MFKNYPKMGQDYLKTPIKILKFGIQSCMQDGASRFRITSSIKISFLLYDFSINQGKNFV